MQPLLHWLFFIFFIFRTFDHDAHARALIGKGYFLPTGEYNDPFSDKGNS